MSYNSIHRNIFLQEKDFCKIDTQLFYGNPWISIELTSTKKTC